MDNVCRSCNHYRPEKAYQSGAKVIMTAPGDWCAGSFSPVSGRHELIPCDVSRASWAGCKQAAELYEPKLLTAPSGTSESSTERVPEHTIEPLIGSAPTQLSADLFDERPNA